MNRRFFSQWLAMTAGSIGLATARGEPARAAEPEPARGPASKTTPHAEPVNVAEFEAWAKATLPRATFEYISTGTTDEVTLRDNVAAFQRLKLLPPLLAGVANVDLSTTVLKTPVSLPILLAPVAGQSLYHLEGGLAAARAAAAEGTIYGVSSSVGHSIEEIAAAAKGPKWFQLYVPKDRGIAKQLVQRAERAGYTAIVLTVDLGERKDADRRNRFTLPEGELRRHLLNVGFPGIEGMDYRALLAFNDTAWDLTLTWEIFDWLRSITKLPVLIKGVLRPDDAKKAVSLGLDGIVVSNHGGRRLDGVPASIDQLASVVETVAGRAEVFLDSGVRRGTDVLKALALGARAVLIGRPYAWALAANGEAGVRAVLTLLREELVSAMLASGCANIASIPRSLVLSSPPQA